MLLCLMAADGSCSNDLIWLDNESGIFYSIGANALNETEMMHIASNIRIVK